MKTLLAAITAAFILLTGDVFASTYEPNQCFAIYALGSSQGPSERRERFEKEAIVFLKIMGQSFKTEEELLQEVKKSLNTLQLILESKSNEEKVEYMRISGQECQILKIEKLLELSSKIGSQVNK